MSLYQSQRVVKPKIEDVAGDYINGNNLKSLMDFLGFLKDNKLSPRWQSGNSWTVQYRGQTVCHIKLDSTIWRIMFSLASREKWFSGSDQYFADDEEKAFIWASVKEAWCPRGCKGKITVLGKEFHDVCVCWAVRIENPDGAALEQSKRVILAIRGFIADLPAVGKA